VWKFLQPFSEMVVDAQVCDRVLEKFERVAIPLAQEYGALPVIGIGHSCGALLQVGIQIG
jgi:hypothetical protein